MQDSCETVAEALSANFASRTYFSQNSFCSAAASVAAVGLRGGQLIFGTCRYIPAEANMGMYDKKIFFKEDTAGRGVSCLQFQPQL